MAELTFLRDLAVVMMVAAATTVLFHRLKQPVVLGLIAAGLVIGPNTPIPLITDSATIETLAQLGILFIMFSLGLEFNLGKLKSVGFVAFAAASMETLITLAIGFGVGRAFGWPLLDSLFLGAILAISSSSIIVNILTEMGKIKEESSHILFAVLLAEDVAAILIIALLGGGLQAGGLPGFELALLVVMKVAIFIIATVILGLVVVPWIVDKVRGLGSSMVLTVTVLGLLFGLGLLAESLHFSLALGGFLVGALIAESRSAEEVAERVVPLRDMFTAVFFVAVGLQLDPALVLTYWFPILVITLVSIFGKILAGAFAIFVAGYPPATAVRVGMGLAMIGEFSFIIAGLADGIVTVPLFPIAVTVSAATTFVTPMLIRRSDRIVQTVARAMPQPVRTYGSLYGSWVRRLRHESRARGVLVPGVPRGTVPRLVVYGLLFVGLLIAGNVLSGAAVRVLGNELFIPGDVPVAVWAACGLLAVPVLLLFARTLRLLMNGLVEAAIPGHLQAEDVGGVSRALRMTFWFAATVAFAAVALAAGAPFLPSGPLLLLILGVLAAASVLLWGAVRRIHESVQRAVDEVLSAAPAASKPSRDEVYTLLQSQYPWDAHLDTVVVPEHGLAAHRRIRDLNLRQFTGASIVSVSRRGKGRPRGPDPDTVLEPGDTLVLLGEREQLLEARRLIHMREREGGDEAAAATPVFREVVLPHGAPLVGTPIALAGLRERAGVTVLGLKRGEHAWVNPDPATVLHAGDVLVLWGSEAELERAVALVEASGSGVAGPKKTGPGGPEGAPGDAA